MLLSFDTKRLYGCDGQLKILVEPLPAGRTEWQSYYQSWAIAEGSRGLSHSNML